MTFDYKKEYKEFYMPKSKPAIVNIPTMNYIAVEGAGNPNDEDSEYKKSIGILYALAYTIKMSYKGDYRIDGYFEYVVPPLEGFWWMEDIKGFDYNRKDEFKFISVIRLPDFVKIKDFDWAVKTATEKKQIDLGKAKFLTLTEGECVQCMHIGSYDDEPSTIKVMEEYAEANGYIIDINDIRRHHEIYLSDARKTKPDNLKTVIRIPIRKL